MAAEAEIINQNAGIPPLDCPDCGTQISWSDTKCSKCGLDKELYFAELRAIYLLVCNRKTYFKIALGSAASFVAVIAYLIHREKSPLESPIIFGLFALSLTVLVVAFSLWNKKKSAIKRFKSLHQDIQHAGNTQKGLRLARSSR
jgi:hypothetical protein